VWVSRIQLPEVLEDLKMTTRQREGEFDFSLLELGKKLHENSRSSSL
jgi:hypothetical protein